MNDDIFTFIEQLEFTPGSPEWRVMTQAERNLAAFAALMSDHATDGLWNVVWSGSGDAPNYYEALDALGASWLVEELRALAAIVDIESEEASRRLELTWRNVEARHRELWGLAAAYALANIPASRWERRT